jgi:octaprenyl-diphosphate synthase
MEIKEVFSLLKKDLDRVEKTFSEHTLSEVALATKISNYLLFSGGKRIRPAIFLLCAKLCGCKKAFVYHIACAIELLHTATLLHDDVIDNGTLRRGKKTANLVWDNKACILTGDFINTSVFKILIKARSFELLDLFAETTTDLANGEIFQLTKERDPKITKDDYFYIVKNKTAILLAAASVSGAILAERPPKEKKALKAFGMNLGMAFQVIDDALDYEADEKKLGKAMLADLNEGRVTLPLIHILEIGNREDKRTIKNIIKKEKRNNSDMKSIYRLIKKYDCIEYVNGVAEDYVRKSVNQLGVFPDSKEKEALLTVADFVTSRKY